MAGFHCFSKRISPGPLHCDPLFLQRLPISCDALGASKRCNSVTIQLRSLSGLCFGSVLGGLRAMFSRLAEVRLFLTRCLGALERSGVLPRQVIELVSWRAKASRYHRWAGPTGATVLRFDGKPLHYACPSCFKRRLIGMLHPDADGCLYGCSICGQQYLLKERPQRPPTSYGPTGIV